MIPMVSRYGLTQFAVAPLVGGELAFQLQHLRPLQIFFLHEDALGPQLFGQGGDDGLFRVHLFLQAEYLLAHLRYLRVQQFRLALVGCASGLEHLAFAFQHILAAVGVCQFEQFAVPADGLEQRLLGRVTVPRGKEQDQILVGHVHRGVDGDALQRDERLSGVYPVAFPYMDDVDDAAFQMLYGLAFGIYDDGARHDDRAADLAEDGPAAEDAEKEEQDGESLSDDGAKALIGGVRFRRRRRLCRG